MDTSEAESISYRAWQVVEHTKCISFKFALRFGIIRDIFATQRQREVSDIMGSLSCLLSIQQYSKHQYN